MKPKKAQKILKEFDFFLKNQKGEQPFFMGLSDNQRKNFIEYAKGLLAKQNKKVSPNLESLKSAILTGDGSKNKHILKDEITFTQPKEVGEKAISNGIYIIKITPFFIVDGKASGFIYYKNNNGCDIHIDKGICNARIPIDSNFIIEKLFINNDSIIRLIGDAVVLSNKAWCQEGNMLVIF